MTAKRLFYKIIYPFRKLYWFVFRPYTVGVKCLIEHEGKFLCIRNSYYPRWTFPGGKVERRESFTHAAQREVREEVGLDIYDWKALGEYRSTREYKKDVVHCFHAYAQTPDFVIDNDEVVEARWFSENEIPQNQSFAIEEVLRLYRERQV